MKLPLEDWSLRKLLLGEVGAQEIAPGNFGSRGDWLKGIGLGGMGSREMGSGMICSGGDSVVPGEIGSGHIVSGANRLWEDELLRHERQGDWP